MSFKAWEELKVLRAEINFIVRIKIKLLNKCARAPFQFQHGTNPSQDKPSQAKSCQLVEPCHTPSHSHSHVWRGILTKHMAT